MGVHEGHSRGFCGSVSKLPEDLFRKVVECYIATVYYAGVAMIGRSFPYAKEVVKVDAWKAAFENSLLQEAFYHFFCDALPANFERMVAEEVVKHPLKGIAPALVPLSTKEARKEWEKKLQEFEFLEKEVYTWASTNIGYFPEIPDEMRDYEEDIPDEEGEDGQAF